MKRLSKELTQDITQMSKLIDLTGQTFNDLTVLLRNDCDSTGKTAWLCRCKCGKITTITGLNLKNNNSKTCGCKKYLSGLDNPRTITDPSRLQEKKRALGTVKTWRKKILKRDQYDLIFFSTSAFVY